MKGLIAIAGFSFGAVLLVAQNRMNYSLVSQESGHVALGLAVRKLTVSGTFLQAPAHPDDETNALFALFGHGMGLRAIDLQNNRGDGGQNEIGPELFADMAVLRTSELLAAHRLDGAEQYFTRAIDYGYSFDPEEVIGKWGRKEIVGDYARLFRTLRPDVVVTMNIQGRGGDRAHEATTVLVREGYLASGDPAMYPEQLREGLRPWTPKKLYFFSSGGGGGCRGGRGGGGGADERQASTVKVTPVNTAAYDGLLGRTYAEIGADARASHKCQGMGLNVGPPPGGGGGGGRGRGSAGRARRCGGNGASGDGYGTGARGGDARARRVSAAIVVSIRPKGERGVVAVRWGRRQPDFDRAVRGCESSTGVDVGTNVDIDGRAAGPGGVRLGERCGSSGTGGGRPRGAARSSRAAFRDGAERWGALRNRLPAETKGARLGP
jgi:GlcNAc-PI de-N-acetylase